MNNANNPESKVIDQWQKPVLLGAICTTFIGVISLTMPFIFMQLKSPLPYMSTPRSKVLLALEHISKLNSQPNHVSAVGATTKKQSTKVFYDLGSGDGEAVLAAASVGWHSTGIEMNPTLYLISQIRRMFSKPDVRQRCQFILGDMFAHNLQNADAVMIFGVKPLMPRIANKVKEECVPGTFLLSYRFIIPTVVEEMDNDDSIGEDKDELLKASMLFDEEEMRVWLVDDDRK